MAILARPVPSSVSAPSRASRRPRRAVGRLGVGLSFTGPGTLIVVGLSIFPAIWAFFLSREKWNGFTPATDIGWLNYQRMASDPDLAAAVDHTLLFTALFVPASILLGLLLAVALNRPIRFVGFYRTCIFVPFVASAVATGILGNYVFNPQFGVANNILRVLGLPAQGLLESQQQAMIVIAVMALWQQLGFTVVVYLAALQDMPADLVEAARVDGASAPRIFRHIVLPQLAPVTVFTTIWQTITALQLFDLVFVTTKGGPLGSTETVVYYLWDQAFRGLRFGYGSAVAYGLFAVTMLITIGMVVYSRRAKVEAF
ncbi:sugar ABC transporter permease [Fodinicola feengrottensis]|uniref:Sugar ABC transporter permease n=1 Tax=Fodinicola feengrottensis TaxID=435914 RepID=A0ABP4S5B7_9ACTN